MQIIFSLSKVSEDLYWTRYSEHLNPIEIRHMCKKIFGDDFNTKSIQTGTLKSRTGELRFVPSGTDGNVCLYNDRILKNAEDFCVFMKPMPVKTPFGAGDFYIGIEGENRKLSYLVWSKAKNQLVYFPDSEALSDYYDTLGVSPGLTHMKSYPTRRIFN